MNMFKPVNAKTVKEYIGMLEPARREQMEKLHAFIQKTVPKLKPHFANNMIGYGSFPYLNYKKEWIEWPVIALASQKQHISVYVCAVDGKQYVAERHAKDLGKVSVGKSCIRFKKLEDVHLPTLKKVLLIAQKQPGLQSAAMKKEKR